MRRLGRLSSALALSLSLAAGGLVALVPGLAAPASAATQIIPVPTSAAGLGRIVTSPDGNMWFVEQDVNKVGRISPTGQITEFQFPAEFPGTTQLEDLDVAPDGTVWVLYESGERIRHIRPDFSTISDRVIGNYPYGKKVRVAPDGTAWVTMSYDEQFVTLVNDSGYVDLPNSPECQDALGRAADGSMWCRTSSGLNHLNPAGGGVNYPVNNYAAYPYAIAAGPVGSIWFGRYFSGTWVTSPDDGEVGYLDASTAQVVAFNTGERTAPNSLVLGPDGNMWFTSIGAAAGIGHISAGGQGALTAIGNYEPNSLTFAADGAIFATDSTNNVIIRVTTDQLQTTNVDPGTGSVFTQATGGGGGGGTTPAATVVGKLQTPKKPAKVAKNKVPVRVVCPAGDTACQGTVTVTTATKKPKVVARTATYTLQPGKKKTLKLALTKKGKKLVRKGKVTKLRFQLSADGAKTVRKVVKVRR